jgi:hypothetical protein
MKNRKEEEKNKVSNSLELERKEHDGYSKKLGRKKNMVSIKLKLRRTG